MAHEHWQRIWSTALTSSVANGNNNASMPLAMKEMLILHFLELKNLFHVKPNATDIARALLVALLKSKILQMKRISISLH
jgi:hypothetical protein